jgi:hypothetical protein
LYLALESKDGQINFDTIAKNFSYAICEKFKTLEQGSAVLKFGISYHACIWIGRNNVSIMISKEEINSFLFLLDALPAKKEKGLESNGSWDQDSNNKKLSKR